MTLPSRILFTRPARERILEEESLKSLITTDSIDVLKPRFGDYMDGKPDTVMLMDFNAKTDVVQLGPLLGKIIHMKVNNESISHLLR